MIAGVHRGFSPAGPGSAGLDAEESINYEFGARYEQDNVLAEVIGFYSDYGNLLGRCRVSDSGCQPGEEFSGGEVDIWGVELSGEYTFGLGKGFDVQIRGAYTYTQSEFQSDFFSSFSQFGIVQAGDELPYLPEHLASASVALTKRNWQVSAGLKYQSQMREEPSQAAIADGIHADDYAIADASASWFVNDRLTLQVVAKNVADERSIVAHRPYGARPNHPQALLARVKYRFF